MNMIEYYIFLGGYLIISNLRGKEWIDFTVSSATFLAQLAVRCIGNGFKN
jgi:hypothetical protein